MVSVLALSFNAAWVAMGNSDFCLYPLRARGFAGGMSETEQKIAELAVPESEPRRAARALYWKGWRISSVPGTWGSSAARSAAGRRDEWDKAQAIEHVEASAELRLVKLIEKEVKSGSDYKN